MHILPVHPDSADYNFDLVNDALHHFSNFESQDGRQLTFRNAKHKAMFACYTALAKEAISSPMTLHEQAVRFVRKKIKDDVAGKVTQLGLPNLVAKQVLKYSVIETSML